MRGLSGFRRFGGFATNTTSPQPNKNELLSTMTKVRFVFLDNHVWAWYNLNNAYLRIVPQIANKASGIIMKTVNGVFMSNIDDFLIENDILLRYFGDDAEVVIPNGVKSISHEAFWDHNSLKSITFPASVTSIDARMFYHGDSLERITVDKGNAVYHSVNNCVIETKSKKLVAACNGSIIPNDGSITSIGEWAFSGYSSLTNITIPESIASIGKYAFNSRDNLASIDIPSSVTSIGEGAFSQCMSLRNITIPNSVTSIDKNAFAECICLENIILPPSITKISERVFWCCFELKNVAIPSSVTSIEELAFGNCKALAFTTPAGSYAAEYAKKNGIKVNLI